MNLEYRRIHLIPLACFILIDSLQITREHEVLFNYKYIYRNRHYLGPNRFKVTSIYIFVGRGIKKDGRDKYVLLFYK